MCVCVCVCVCICISIDRFPDYCRGFFSQDIFFLTDVSRTGTLSLSELRNALVTAGKPATFIESYTENMRYTQVIIIVIVVIVVSTAS